MHAALPLSALVLITLTACATPLERCLNSSNAEVRRLQSAISTAETNIARGYGVHRHQESYLVPKTCHDKRDRPYRCPQTRYRTVETPVAIDVGAEAEKHAALSRQLAAAQTRATRQSDQCFAALPKD